MQRPQMQLTKHGYSWGWIKTKKKMHRRGNTVHDFEYVLEDYPEIIETDDDENREFLDFTHVNNGIRGDVNDKDLRKERKKLILNAKVEKQ